MLAPLLLVVEKGLWSSHKTLRQADHQWISPPSSDVWVTALIAFTSIFFLSDWSLRGCVLSMLPVACILLIYVALIPRIVEDSFRLPQIDINETIIPISCRTLLILMATLCIQMTLYGFPNGFLLPSLLSGLAKVLSRYWTIRAVCCPLPNKRMRI